jgi:hypothetical protein
LRTALPAPEFRHDLVADRGHVGDRVAVASREDVRAIGDRKLGNTQRDGLNMTPRQRERVEPEEAKGRLLDDVLPVVTRRIPGDHAGLSVDMDRNVLRRQGRVPEGQAERGDGDDGEPAVRLKSVQRDSLLIAWKVR